MKNPSAKYTTMHDVTLLPLTTSFCRTSSTKINQSAAMDTLRPNTPLTKARHQKTFSFGRSLVVNEVTSNCDPMKLSRNTTRKNRKVRVTVVIFVWALVLFTPSRAGNRYRSGSIAILQGEGNWCYIALCDVIHKMAHLPIFQEYYSY